MTFLPILEVGDVVPCNTFSLHPLGCTLAYIQPQVNNLINFVNTWIKESDYLVVGGIPVWTRLVDGHSLPLSSTVHVCWFIFRSFSSRVANPFHHASWAWGLQRQPTGNPAQAWETVEGRKHQKTIVMYRCALISRWAWIIVPLLLVQLTGQECLRFSECRLERTGTPMGTGLSLYILSLQPTSSSLRQSMEIQIIWDRDPLPPLLLVNGGTLKSSTSWKTESMSTTWRSAKWWNIPQRTRIRQNSRMYWCLPRIPGIQRNLPTSGRSPFKP